MTTQGLSLQESPAQSTSPPARLPGFQLSPGGYGRPRRPVPDAVYHLRPVGVPSRRIPDILSIAATGVLPSRRIPDILSINDGGAGMPIKGMIAERAIRRNPAPINRPGAVSWIPAFAGMTMEGETHPGNLRCHSFHSCPCRHSGAGRNPVVYTLHSGLERE